VGSVVFRLMADFEGDWLEEVEPGAKREPFEPAAVFRLVGAMGRSFPASRAAILRWGSQVTALELGVAAKDGEWTGLLREAAPPPRSWRFASLELGHELTSTFDGRTSFLTLCRERKASGPKLAPIAEGEELSLSPPSDIPILLVVGFTEEGRCGDAWDVESPKTIELEKDEWRVLEDVGGGVEKPRSRLILGVAVLGVYRLVYCMRGCFLSISFKWTMVADG